MPKLGTTMQTGVLTAWHKNVGEFVNAGELLMTVESNKAQVEIDSTTAGFLVKILHNVGDEVPVATVLGYLADQVNEMPDSSRQSQTPTMVQQSGRSREEVKPEVRITTTASTPGKTLASPKARALAKEYGINLGTIPGTGENGMVTAMDVQEVIQRERSETFQSFPKSTPTAQAVAARAGIDLSSVSGSGDRGRVMKDDVLAAITGQQSGDDQLIPFGGMRKIIAETMMASVHGMAHAYHWAQVDMSEAARLRSGLKQEGRPVSYNALILLATAKVLLEFPPMNSVYTNNGILRKSRVNLGFAVALQDGLIVPNIKDASSKNLHGIAAESERLAAKAKEGTLAKDEYSGGTFTVTNLGMYGLDGFLAIINPPEAGILSVGRIAEAVDAEDGNIVVKPFCTLGLTYDHRIVDGGLAAQFLVRIRQLLENPSLML